MAKDLYHSDAARFDIATAVRDLLETGTSAVNIKWYTQAATAHTTSNFTAVGSSSLGTGNPFGTGPITGTPSFQVTGLASSTWTNTGTSKVIASFGLFNNHATPVKTLWGTVGNSTGTFDVEIVGGNTIGQNEKLKITSFTYLASQ